MQNKPIVPIEDTPQNNPKKDWITAVAVVVLLIALVYVVVKIL